MNTWQVLRELKCKLVSRNWAGSSNVVFAGGAAGSVVITMALPAESKHLRRVPMALIAPGEAQSDPEHDEEPDLIRQMISVSLIVAIPSDDFGQAALIGGNVPDRTQSQNRGVLELEEELFAAIERVTTDDGIQIVHRASSVPRPQLDEALGYVVMRDYTFEAWVTADRFYHTATAFGETGGVGSVTLSWTLPPDRHDRYRMILRRSLGSTAPSSITDGTGVTLSGNLATTVVDSGLSPGTYSYALFASYDEDRARPEGTPTTDQRVSASVTRTSTVT